MGLGIVDRVQLRYNVRLYPSQGQRESLARAFGCARVVFNDGLRLRRQAWEEGLPYISDGDLSKQIITEAKQTPERVWLGEVSAVVLQQALADLSAAYRTFFSSVSGKRKGRAVGPPRFRSRKDSRQSVRFTRNARFAVTPPCDGGRWAPPSHTPVDTRDFVRPEWRDGVLTLVAMPAVTGLAPFEVANPTPCCAEHA
ncbi:MAG: transposase, OrfB family protein [Actinomycetia bacterium]|nr:transposase, OrfB family protein [Actinomycetes bacterium]